MERRPIVFYHANCLDGFTAAYVAWERYKDTADYHALDYKDVIPLDLITNRPVYMLDMCLTEDRMRMIADVSKHPVLVLDHHIGMQETFLKLQAENIVYGSFALQFSGAGLTWNWFNGPETAPWLIRAVEDRDLWKFHIADTKSVLAYMAAYDFDFEIWYNFARLLEDPANRRDFAARGNAILQYKNRLIRSACANRVIYKTIGGVPEIPTVNLDYSMASDAGHMLAEAAPFAAIYNDEPDGRRYSLRSSKQSGLDVCAIAKQYGGGGHKNAAGFFVSWNRIADIENEFAGETAQAGLGPK